MKRTTLLRLLSVGFTATLLLGGMGCVPGVGWLPDSSGFYFTAGIDFEPNGMAFLKNARLMFFDVATKKVRVVSEDKHMCIRPAVKPDGNEVAVARLVAKPGERTLLQLVFYNRDGKELRTSKTFPTGRIHPDKREGVVGLFWAPKGDKVLIQSLGIYDIMTDDLRLPNDGKNFEVMQFGSTPFRPDGKGFLVDISTKVENGPSNYFAFMDWAGKTYRIDAFENHWPKGEKMPARHLSAEELLLKAEFQQSWWEDAVAVTELGEYQIRVDTEKLVIKLVKVPEAKTDDGKLIHREFKSAGAKARVRVVEIAPPRHLRFESNTRDPKMAPQFRIEMLKPGQNKPQVLVSGADDCVLMPSPNRNLVAVGWRLWNKLGGSPEVGLLVINQEGDVIANLNMRKYIDLEDIHPTPPEPQAPEVAGFPWLWVVGGVATAILMAAVAATLVWRRRTPH